MANWSPRASKRSLPARLGASAVRNWVFASGFSSFAGLTWCTLAEKLFRLRLKVPLFPAVGYALQPAVGDALLGLFLSTW